MTVLVSALLQASAIPNPNPNPSPNINPSPAPNPNPGPNLNLLVTGLVSALLQASAIRQAVRQHHTPKPTLLERARAALGELPALQRGKAILAVSGARLERDSGGIAAGLLWECYGIGA